ncbi:protein TusC [Thalassotalea loyana]|uniref:Protein TusC n=1 Tax=Thalassotalea loyana TaxID=280483 RepID=A0ABQ6HD69_9GAMM|nr:sulfurtransferase complex subunit TusC [Thalassotalea loyana]GLX85384.1 protein TusC [Thalassotalea loyana]
MEKSIAIINTSAPLMSTHAKDSLDLALILGSYEQAPSLFFIGDGVWQLVQQQIDKANAKDFLKTLKALEFYDIENVFVCQNSLVQRNLKEEFSIPGVNVLDAKQLQKQLSSYSSILRF